MSHADAFIELMTNSDSPLSYIQTYSMFDVGSLLANLLKYLWMAICRGLDSFVSAMESFANTCYNFLSFSGNSAFTSLYDVINQFVTIPIAICLLIIAFKYVTGDMNKTKSKQYLNNLLIVFFVLCIMPSVFSFMNNTVIGKDFLKTVGGSDTTTSNYTIGSVQVTQSNSNNSHITTSNEILRGNTTDFLYLYQESGKLKAAFPSSQDPDDANEANIDTNAIIEELNELKANYPNTSYAQNVSFDSFRFDFNQILKNGEDNYECPKFYQYKCIGKQESVDNYSNGSTSTINLYEIVPMNTEGFLGTGLGAVAYQRYHIDFLNIFLQLLATGIMYFCIGYSVLKLIFELLIHQLFGPIMAATDLTGGQRIKKYLSSIIGCYFGLIISSIIVLLYNKAVAIIPNTHPLIKSMMVISLAIIFLDGPNIIAKYFGVNTGIRAGMAAAGLAMMKAGRAVTAPIRTASRVGSSVGLSALNNRVRDGMNAPRERQREEQRRAENNRRENQRQTENRQREAQRQAENRQREEQRQAEKMDRFNRDMDRFQGKHGSNGDYEQYQKPNAYDPNKSGSKENLNHIAGKAAMASAFSDMMGNPQNKDAYISDSVNGISGITEQDKNAAKRLGNANIKDAKQGIYTGIAKEAEANGGTRKDYLKASESAIQAYNSMPETEAAKEDFKSYLADASMNAAHTDELRQQANNYKALDPKSSDIDCYVKAMSNSNLGFSTDNMQQIARAELEQNGSLRSGNIYSNRPVQPMSNNQGGQNNTTNNGAGTNQTGRVNTQTRGLS